MLLSVPSFATIPMPTSGYISRDDPNYHWRGLLYGNAVAIDYRRAYLFACCYALHATNSLRSILIRVDTDNNGVEEAFLFPGKSSTDGIVGQILVDGDGYVYVVTEHGVSPTYPGSSNVCFVYKYDANFTFVSKSAPIDKLNQDATGGTGTAPATLLDTTDGGKYIVLAGRVDTTLPNSNSGYVAIVDREVMTVAYTGLVGDYYTGAGTLVVDTTPGSLAVDANGVIYVAWWDPTKIWKIEKSGSTFAVSSELTSVGGLVQSYIPSHNLLFPALTTDHLVYSIADGSMILGYTQLGQDPFQAGIPYVIRFRMLNGDLLTSKQMSLVRDFYFDCPKIQNGFGFDGKGFVVVDEIVRSTPSGRVVAVDALLNVIDVTSVLAQADGAPPIPIDPTADNPRWWFADNKNQCVWTAQPQNDNSTDGYPSRIERINILGLGFWGSVIVAPPNALSKLVIIGHGVNCNSYDNKQQISGATLDAWAVGHGKLLGDISDLDDWCHANGIHVALSQDSQRSAKDLLDELAIVGNSAPVYSGDRLNFIPYDEISAAGGGRIYISPTAKGPIARLTDLDIISEKDKPPVQITRKRRTSGDNAVSIEHYERSIDYARKITTEVYQLGVTLYGPRKGGQLDSAAIGYAHPQGAKTMLSIHDTTVAQNITSILVKKSGTLPNIHKLKAKAEWFWLEAMDLITIEDKRMGLPETPVRITLAHENEDKTWSLEAESFIYGLNHPDPAEAAFPLSTYVQTNVDPGLVNRPIIFEPPLGLSSSGSQELWFILSGSTDGYGGCVAYMSTDGGLSYPFTLGVCGIGVTGTLSGVTPQGQDPDVINYFDLDLSESRGSVSTDPQDYADRFINPCYIEGEAAGAYELICPTKATLTGSYLYRLDTYIRRGVFSSTNEQHSQGKRFAELGSAALRVILDPTLVGRVLHFKFAAFNKVKTQQNTLSSCADYTYTPIGTPTVGGGGIVVVSVNGNPVTEVPINPSPTGRGGGGNGVMMLPEDR